MLLPPGKAEGVEETAGKVKRVISGHLGIAEATVTPEASLVEDLGADSLDIVELVIAFEEAFAVELPQADIERIRTVQDAIEYVEMHRAS